MEICPNIAKLLSTSFFTFSSISSYFLWVVFFLSIFRYGPWTQPHQHANIISIFLPFFGMFCNHVTHSFWLCSIFRDGPWILNTAPSWSWQWWIPWLFFTYFSLLLYLSVSIFQTAFYIWIWTLNPEHSISNLLSNMLIFYTFFAILFAIFADFMAAFLLKRKGSRGDER